MEVVAWEKDMPALLGRCNIVAYPTYHEGLPKTLLEAASYGLPVVASDIPPHVEVLGSEGAGQRLFRSGDEFELAAALDRVLADPARERAGAADLRDRVLRDYRWDEVTSATEDVYLRSLGRADKAPADDRHDLRPDRTTVPTGSSR